MRIRFDKYLVFVAWKHSLSMTNVLLGSELSMVEQKSVVTVVILKQTYVAVKFVVPSIYHPFQICSYHT